MILSVSRRTDIPNYYSDWFIARIKACHMRNDNRNLKFALRMPYRIIAAVFFYNLHHILQTDAVAALFGAGEYDKLGDYLKQISGEVLHDLDSSLAPHSGYCGQTI